MNKRKYVVPYSASEESDALDAILDQGGSVAEETTGTDTVETQVETQADPQTETQTPQQQQGSKADYAFAQLRTERENLSKLLGKVASAAGIQYDNEQELIAKLNDDAINKMAQQQNVPVELLRRLEELEQDSQTLRQNKLQEQAISGFQSVMAKYSLNNDELKAFAAKLDEVGKNPFEASIDLEAEYKVLFFEDILGKQVQAAVQAALAKSGQADVHSTAPNKAVGGTTEPTGKITTISGLNAFLDGK